MSSDTTVLPWIVSRFNSRYGDDRRVWKVSENEYKIVGKSHFMRGATDGKRTIFADFEGGPMVAIGDDLMQYGIVGDTRFVSEIVIGDEKDAMTGENLSSVTFKVSAIREKVDF
jgi:hypothetical protein